MTLDRQRARRCLRDLDLESLFVEELGWDRYSESLPIELDDQLFTLKGAAEKRGLVALTCAPLPDGSMPDRGMRFKMERKVAKLHHEHIIVFVDDANTVQVWQWVKRELGKPARCREQTYHTAQSGEPLIQRLETIAFSLKEEEGLTTVDAVSRVRAAFDVDRVTKRFYDRFKKEHDKFLKFIKGIPDHELRPWYASVMLNRLMFIYFIQKKGFLDGDSDYLRNKLAESRKRGKDRYYSKFLCPLFFEGFARKENERSAATNRLLGKVPYLNGGIFLPHQIELHHGKRIKIADSAFKRLFDFFDHYRWHLDERPLRDDREINPDVLGYIFEKYINQKELGAYYSKEDITGYISRNTVIPHLFDVARRKCKIAFEGKQSVWRLLRADPDRYVFPAVRKGADLPLPPEIDAGLDDVSKRTKWNETAPSEFALPTEIWREVVARRKRYEEVRGKLESGEVRDINDLITYNLDMEQFAQDAIETSEGPELLRAFWHAIQNVTVLDPACGSGAFLFAALNILESLYEACLDRMETSVEELDASGEKHRPEKSNDFRKVLARVAKHPSRKYFVFKSIIINNIYGVDIMGEAVEICKLRLFLKLVAQVDRVEKVEPLPDIDFNIRAGNTLVGFAMMNQVKRSVDDLPGRNMGLVHEEAEARFRRIEEEAEIAGRAFRKFREMQTEQGMLSKDFAEAKESLRSRLGKLTGELDRFLAGEYGVDTRKEDALEKWRKSHQPFHWFAEFYGIMKSGGFDVVMGNPPYVEKSRLKGRYAPLTCRTLECRDIYAWFVERSFDLVSAEAGIGLIVPVSIASSGSFDKARDVLDTTGRAMWLSHFANRPGQLFEGAQNRLTILLSSAIGSQPGIHGSRYHRWDAKRGERESLLSLVRYGCLNDLGRKHCGLYPKIGSRLGESTVRKMLRFPSLAESLAKPSPHEVCWVRVPGYFCQFFLDPPKARSEKGGAERERGELNRICLAGGRQRRVAHAVLNSTSFAVFFWAYSDGRHMNPSDVKLFPVGLDCMELSTASDLVKLSRRLETGMHKHKSLWRKSGLLIDSFDSAGVKPIIDEIDRVLARHYGFTDEELDFIINYDIKYRMGLADG